MATSEFWQRVTSPSSSAGDWSIPETSTPLRGQLRGSAKLWMILDALMVLGSAAIAIAFQLSRYPATATHSWVQAVFQEHSTNLLLLLLVFFLVALIVTSRQLRLYSPLCFSSYLHEQRLSLQACLTASLLLTGILYFLKASDIPRTVVFLTLMLATFSLSLRRFLYRMYMYRRFSRGLGMRSVLIAGTGPEAHALRHHIESIRNLGFSFKGFVDVSSTVCHYSTPGGEVVGSIDSLFEHARKQFIDEIFMTAPCEQGLLQDVLKRSRVHGIDLRVVPDLYDGLTWNAEVEYVGQFPTIPIHRRHVPEIGLFLKRGFDIVFAALALLCLLPVLFAVALAVRLDSAGPVFYASDRIGKKGRVFRCVKFRTMVVDAEKRRSEVQHLNERDTVLFKITNDPRITKLGHFLRKYSLDELPQFINVLRGEMSVVGPRPPIASEVREYKLNHLRRLDVMPGITGLWQVQGRQDPSFDSYVSLDVAYIENWSLWLDLKIILRTVGVVFAGTGS